LQFSRENIFLKKMMNYKIITDLENKVLTSKCEEVKNFDENLIEEIGGMQETMLTPQNKDKVVGVGLAANQVGIDKRMFLLTLNAESKNSKIIPIINPQIIEFSREKIIIEEGCLSIPEFYKGVSRPRWIRARWQNLQGNWCEKKMSGMDARIFQHENDHLDGILFTKYLK
jgi:peptide deformylase